MKVNASPIVGFGVLMCIGCVEQRIRRKLNVNDFANVPLNTGYRFAQSERLASRLEGFEYNPDRESGIWGWTEMAQNNVRY